MKKIYMLLFAVVPAMAMAQPNNPEDAKGLEFERSVNSLAAEIKAGKTKSFDQATLNAYSKRALPANKVTEEVFTQVYKSVKDPAFDCNTYIRKSSLSENKKAFFTEINASFLKTDRAGFQKYLETKTEAIKKSRLSETEKTEQLLSIAILYHSRENVAGRRPPSQTQEFGCAEYPSTCGAVIGMIVGQFICGPICSVGGALVGALVGAFIGFSK